MLKAAAIAIWYPPGDQLFGPFVSRTLGEAGPDDRPRPPLPRGDGIRAAPAVHFAGGAGLFNIGGRGDRGDRGPPPPATHGVTGTAAILLHLMIAGKVSPEDIEAARSPV